MTSRQPHNFAPFYPRLIIRILGFDQGQWTSLTGTIESGLLPMVGQNIAAQLATLEPRVMRSFGCHDVGLKQLQHAFSLFHVVVRKYGKIQEFVFSTRNPEAVMKAIRERTGQTAS